jgi:hypothetical protein
MNSKSGRWPGGGYLPLYWHHDAIWRIGDDDKGHGKLTSRRTDCEPPSCEQCHHDQHCSIMSCHVMTWEQDHDDNYTRTCTNARTRWPSLQARFTSFPSLELMTTWSGEPISISYLALGLYIRVARPPFHGNRLSRLHLGSHSPHSSYLFPLAYTPHCKNFRAFNRGTHTRTLPKTGHRASHELV